MSTPPPTHERILGGRYRLVRIVGNGAMGRVWAAHDEVLNRAVAIKEVDFPPGMPASEVEQIVQRTMREARAVASVSDPHVVTIFDMLSLPHGPAIVMELLSARSLAEIISINGPMADYEAAAIGVSVASGLLAAHSAGITHRDVKPGNVLICDDGRIKLTDFGIARSAGEQTITATGLLLGSPAYISPEVASGRPANAQSDAWGLGALLFACVQGVPPYDAGTPLATLTAVVQDPVPPYPNSGRLSGVIRGLLVKDPSTRMSVGLAHQAMLRVAAESGHPVISTWKSAAWVPTAPSPARVDAAGTGAAGISAAGIGQPEPYQPHPDESDSYQAQRIQAQPYGPNSVPQSRAAQRYAPQSLPHSPAAQPYRPQVSPLRGGPSPVGTSGGPQHQRATDRPPPPPWTGPRPALPPPPWAQAGATSLRPLPVHAPVRTVRRKAVLAVLALLVTIVAAVIGYFGVRTIAHLENGVPIVGSSALAAESAAPGDSAAVRGKSTV